MDIKALLNSILEVAEAAAPLVGNGAPEAVDLANRVVEMIDHASDTLKQPGVQLYPEEQAALDARRDVLEAAIAGRVDETVKKLRGE